MAGIPPKQTSRRAPKHSEIDRKRNVEMYAGPTSSPTGSRQRGFHATRFLGEESAMNSSNERLLWDELRNSLAAAVEAEEVLHREHIGGDIRGNASRVKETNVERRRLVDQAIAVLLQDSDGGEGGYDTL